MAQPPEQSPREQLSPNETRKRQSRAIPIIDPQQRLPYAAVAAQSTVSKGARPGTITSPPASGIATPSQSQRSASNGQTATSSDLTSVSTSSVDYDVYARPYVPEYLRRINDAPAQRIYAVAPKPIDYDRYVSTFAGFDLLPKHATRTRNPTADSTPPSRLQQQDRDALSMAPHKSDHKFEYDREAAKKATATTVLLPDHLTLDNYAQYWSTTLSHELLALRNDYGLLDLFDTTLKRRAPGTNHKYFLQLAGLAEVGLRFEVGDEVLLRQLVVNRQMAPPGSRRWLQPGFTGYELVAYIVAIDRKREKFELCVEGVHHQPESLSFNARFLPCMRRQEALSTALQCAAFSLSQKNLQDENHDTISADGAKRSTNGDIKTDEIQAERSPGHWMKCMLFPKESHASQQLHLDLPSSSLVNQLDTSLNLEQQRAVAFVTRQNYGMVPFLIDGPPGTGKTKTMVEAILQLARPDSSHILVCAPSDPAADTLALRLGAYLDPKQLLRLQDPWRTFAEVPERLLMFCCIEGERFSIPSFTDLMACTVIVTTCRDADILVNARVTNNDLTVLENNLMSALHPAQAREPVSLHWKALFIDEAAQATEPEALIPLSVVAPPDSIPYHGNPTFVMAGDPRQLNPRTASKTLAIETSLFARLAGRTLYSNHPMARSKLRNGERPTLTRGMLPMIRPPFETLVRNYRSHPAVLAVPSALFYHDSLVSEAKNITDLMHLSGLQSLWRGRGWPVLFSVNHGPDEVEKEGGGWYNAHEARKALLYAATLVHHGKVEQKDIAIISPFEAQVRKLRSLARSAEYKLHSLNIGPLAAFQGLESRVVILCTTRSRDRFLEQDLAHGKGVIRESKRFNVALTRAKQGLIVIGNPFLLATDENWYTFLAFCHRNGLWAEPHETDDGGNQEAWNTRNEEVPSHISRLETALLYAERQREGERQRANGTNLGPPRRFGDADETDAMYASALAAEAAIRDD